MIMNHRFSLNEGRYIIDTLNPANTGKGYCHLGDPEDDNHLRERVLLVHLDDLLDKLIINLNPMETLPSGEKYQPFNEQRFAVCRSVFSAVRASQLNSAIRQKLPTEPPEFLSLSDEMKWRWFIGPERPTCDIPF
jgi:hypothetical protein